MNTLVVLFALASVACGSLVQVAQPPHHPAIVLDPHGRPLDTAEVINARALHLQAKALEHHAPLVHAAVVVPVAHSVISAPVAHSVYSSPLLAHSYGLAHGHLLKKRSLGHYAYSAPIIAPSAVSHQSRVDVISEPAVVSHAVAAPVLAHAAPVVAAIAPAAVSHQSRVDVRTSPAVVSHAVAPLAHSVYAAPLAHSVYAAPLAHSVYAAPLAHSAYAAPLTHSVYSTGHLGHSGLLHSAPLAHAW